VCCEAMRLAAAVSFFIFRLALLLHLVTNTIMKLVHVVTKTQHKRRHDEQLHCRSGSVQCHGTKGKAKRSTISSLFLCVLCL
jgi:hypothetical protein